MVRIGKSGDNDVVLQGEGVSRYHAQLVRAEEGGWLLEDIGSTNGTFVNGHQVLRRRVKEEDKLVFGGEDCERTLQELLHAAGDYSTEFEALRGVYESYVTEKVRIQSSSIFKVRLLQAVPLALLGVGGLVLGVLGKGNSLLSGVGLVAMVCLPSAGIYLGAKQSAKIPGLLQAQLTEFRARYACPKCGTPFGEQPWEVLAGRGHCPSCKALWKRGEN
jgi:hypothetical protein